MCWVFKVRNRKKDGSLEACQKERYTNFKHSSAGSFELPIQLIHFSGTCYGPGPRWMGEQSPALHTVWPLWPSQLDQGQSMRKKKKSPQDITIWAPSDLVWGPHIKLIGRRCEHLSNRLWKPGKGVEAGKGGLQRDVKNQQRCVARRARPTGSKSQAHLTAMRVPRHLLDLTVTCFLGPLWGLDKSIHTVWGTAES